MTRPCVAVLVIFNTFSCNGVTGTWCSVRRWRSIFQSFPYSGALIEALGTVMVFTAAVGIAKAIYFSYTITLSTCSIHVDFRPTVLGSSFCITNKFLMSQFKSKFNCDAETRSQNRGFEAHISWACYVWTDYIWFVGCGVTRNFRKEGPRFPHFLGVYFFRLNKFEAD